MSSPRVDARLAASLAASRLLIATGGAAGVDELARAAGISRRTWFRYFPAKEDCIRPMIREATTTTLRIMGERLDSEQVCDAFLAAFASVAGGLFTERTRGLLPVVFASSALSAVLEHEAVYSSEMLRDLLVRRSAPETDGHLIAALATALPALANAALRDSVVDGVPPLDLLTPRVRALRTAHLPLSTTTAERRRP
ncbi:MAG: TetR family transcriptional regulator [Curtobacterium sp.]